MKALTKAQRQALIATVAPMEFKITLTPDQVVEYAETAYCEMLDNYCREATELAGTCDLEFYVDFANDVHFRKMLKDEIDYRLDDAMDNVYVDQDDAEQTPLALMVMREMDKVQDIVDEYSKVAVEDEALQKALTLVQARGFKVSK